MSAKVPRVSEDAIADAMEYLEVAGTGSVRDIMHVLGCSKDYAYNVVRNLKARNLVQEAGTYRDPGARGYPSVIYRPLARNEQAGPVLIEEPGELPEAPQPAAWFL